MMEEIWVGIKGLENKYQVSNLGRIKSLPRTWSNGLFEITIKERVLKQRKGDGYLSIVLYGKGYSVHRLVANHFIPNPENKPNINHKNGTRSDNRVENLEWCTQKENIIHSYATGLQKGIKGRINELNAFSKTIICLETGITYPSAAEVKRKLGIHASHVSDVCLGKRKTAGKLTFKFVQ